MKVLFITLISLLVLSAAVLGSASAYMFSVAVVRKKSHNVTVWDSDSEKAKIIEGHGSYNETLGKRTRWLCTAGSADSAERLSITSLDGLRLTARFIPCPAGKPMRGIMLMMHGYRSNPVFDFGGSAEVMNLLGFALCLPDQRAHGGSEGRYLTYGVREKQDTAEWCSLLAKLHPGVPIILVGISMGASTVMGASALKLPAEVKGTIADCGYTSPDGIFRKVLRHNFKLPAFPIYNITSALVKHLAGFEVKELSCPDAMANRRLPVLIVHGKDDLFVPYSMGEENRKGAEASPQPHVFLAVDGAGHGKSFVVDEVSYTEAVEKLLAICKV